MIRPRGLHVPAILRKFSVVSLMELAPSCLEAGNRDNGMLVGGGRLLGLMRSGRRSQRATR